MNLETLYKPIPPPPPVPPCPPCGNMLLNKYRQPYCMLCGSDPHPARKATPEDWPKRGRDVDKYAKRNTRGKIKEENNEKLGNYRATEGTKRKS